MTERPNLLVVCGRNKRRSRTAEYLFKNDNRFNIRSVGVSPKSDRKISEADLHWADLVLVMEQEQKVKIRELYHHLPLPTIEVLLIEELLPMLTDKINAALARVFGL